MMKSCSIIIQAEGKGHYSQAMALAGILAKNSYEIKRVYQGKSLFQAKSDYYNSFSKSQVSTFFSPGFLRSKNQKGIKISLSIILNILLGPLYLFEIVRIGILLLRDRSHVIFNFYDPVGALACKWLFMKGKQIIISHHFYLSHPDFIHPHGLENSFFLLQLLNRIMINSANRVLALSFREGKKYGKIEITPPLIDQKISSCESKQHGDDLCYFLNPGFVFDALRYYEKHTEINAIIYSESDVAGNIPPNVRIAKPSRSAFIESMGSAKRILTTGGFDTVAEAFYQGISVFVIPSENHYEQFCNSLDAARTGLAFQLDNIEDLEDVDFEPLSNRKYIDWVHSDTFEKIVENPFPNIEA